MVEVVGVVGERGDVVGDQGEVRDRVRIGEVRGGEGGGLKERRDWGLM